MMDFDALRRVWVLRGEAARSPAGDMSDVADGTVLSDVGDMRGMRGMPSMREQLADVRARAERLDRDVRRRDLRESLVALLMLPLFAFLAVIAPSPLSALGAAIVVVACVVIPLRLRRARRAAADPGRPVAEALRVQLERVRAQERLLGTVAWWYFAPLGIGVLLYVLGGASPTTFKLAYLAGVVLLYGWLLRMNHRVVDTDVRPLANELQRWIEDLDDPDTDEGV